MDDEVGSAFFISPHFLDASSSFAPISSASLYSEILSNGNTLKNESEQNTEANDVLKNGILIETNKGLECLSLTEALTSGVGGLNLSVEDFQNVAAQLLHSTSDHKIADSGKNAAPVQCFERNNSKLGSVADTSKRNEGAKVANKDIRPVILSKGVCVSLTNRHTLKLKVLTSSDSSSLTVSESTGTNSDSSVQSGPVTQKLESIAEGSEHHEEAKVAKENFKPVILSKAVSVMPPNKHILKKKFKALTSSDSSSLTVSESNGTNSDSSVQSVPLIQVKRKGGWPKGRKRKPELANRPPKAPCTGYVYYLNEKRKRPEFRSMPFPEVTKFLGNEWTNLSLENKREYLDKAEMDKKRYREEMKVYRNSETYRSYLKRRRIKSYKTNGTEESDFDATDDIDDEDNEELYCRACDQWFTTLHNKKEHLYGKQHFQVVLQTGKGSFSLDESSLDGTSITNLQTLANPDVSSVPDAMYNFFHNIAEREREIRTLQERLKTSVMKNKQILKQLQELKQSMLSMQKLSRKQREDECKLEKVICDLWDVPTMFSTENSLALKSRFDTVIKTIRK